MSVDRPTFSESWHRVAELRPRLRAAVQDFRQYYRGRMWYVLSDPANNQFFRLDEPAYRFIALLDGRRDVAEAWRIVNEDMGDRAPTQGEAIQLLGQLYTSNLLQAELPPDSEQMFARYRKRVQREVGGYLMNFLFVRIPLLDPQPLLRATTHLVGWMFAWPGFLIWLITLGIAGYMLTGQWQHLIEPAREPQQFLFQRENLILLGLCFVITKAIHELGHAYSCAYFGRKGGTGGPVHTIGLMLLVFMPVPYVDASSSWSFRNKWHRAFVAAAGMYVELFVAAIAAILWVKTSQDTIWHELAYNVIFIASISTILFNGNPLLRFDGYYILCDALEIANLAQRSKLHLHYLVKKYIFGVRRARSAAHTAGEKFWLTLYGIASLVYRVFICAAILLYIADVFPLFGMIMAALAIGTWVLMPLGKFIKYLAIEPELERTRSRAITASLAFFIGLIGFLSLYRMPDRDRAEGIVRPVHSMEVAAESAGFVQEVLKTGSAVSPDGEPLLRATNPRTVTQYAERAAQLQQDLLLKDLYAYREDPELVQLQFDAVQKGRQNLQTLKQEIDNLNLRAPIAGTWICPDADVMPGTYVQKGQQVGTVADTSQLIVVMTADQNLGPRIDEEILSGKDHTVELRVRGRPNMRFTGTILKVLAAGQEVLPSAALGMPAGGTTPVSLQDQTGRTSTEPFFEVHIALSPEDAQRVHLGQRMVARFEMPEKPLLEQWIRSIRRLIARRFT